MKYLHPSIVRGLTAFLICTLLPLVASASLIVDVAGAIDSGVRLGPGVEPDAAAMAFSIDEGLTDVTIGAPIACVGCSGSVWLHRTSLGGGANLGDLVAAEAFDASTSTAALFSGIALDPGLYFVIASIEAGFGVWSGSLLPSATLTLASGASAGPYFTADAVPGFVPFGDFDVVLNGLLHLSVEGTQAVASVPETGSLLLLGAALLVLLVRRKPPMRQ